MNKEQVRKIVSHVEAIREEDESLWDKIDEDNLARMEEAQRNGSPTYRAWNGCEWMEFDTPKIVCHVHLEDVAFNPFASLLKG